MRGSALDRLAEYFRFTETQVDDAIRTAAGIAMYRGQPVHEEHLFEAARSRSGHQLANFLTGHTGGGQPGGDGISCVSEHTNELDVANNTGVIRAV